MIAVKNFLVMLLVVASLVDSIIAEPSRNIIKLSHPFNKLNSTSYPSIIAAINASQRRFNSIQRKIKIASNNIMAANNNGTEVRVIPHDLGVCFLASVSLGTPPVEQVLLMDTGSALTWTQCNGCKPCKKQKGPLFDPAVNSFYKLQCGDPRCDLAPSGNALNACGTSCDYKLTYADNSWTVGALGLTTFNFKTSRASTILIGCGLHNGGFREGQYSGLLALGTHESSILNSLGPQFSYCIGSLGNKSPDYHFLILGSGAIMAGDPSPMIIENHNYYVALEGIMVGDVSLDIDPGVFRMQADKTGGVIIDSGSIITYLAKPAYEKLRDEIAKLLEDLPIVKSSNYPKLLCFNGWLQNSYVPPVTLKFANNQTISMGMTSIFYQMNLNLFCMIVAESTFSVSMIGIFAQQYYNIGYDVPAKNIYFYRTDCERV